MVLYLYTCLQYEMNVEVFALYRTDVVYSIDKSEWNNVTTSFPSGDQKQVLNAINDKWCKYCRKQVFSV